MRDRYIRLLRLTDSSVSFKKVTIAVLVTNLIMASCLPLKVYGQVNPKNDKKSSGSSYIAKNISDTKVIKLNLSDPGVAVGSDRFRGRAGIIQKESSGWVRLEITGNKVRLVQTTRVTNWLTQFSKWWDHPVRNVAFKPDSCTSNSPTQSNSSLEARLREIRDLYDQKLISREQYEALQKKIVDSASVASVDNTAMGGERCLISSNSDTIEMTDGMRIEKGEFKMQYLESNKWRTVAFRVPEKVSPSN